MSETPRTDAGSWHVRIPGDPAGADVVYQSLARTLERELAAAHQRIEELEKDKARLADALEFYANPETYHACAFLFDPPTGGFDKDFDDGHNGYDRPMPGKAAREALASMSKEPTK